MENNEFSWNKSVIARFIFNREGNGKQNDIIKYIVTHVMRLVVRCFYIFPIKKKRLIFYSYTGKQYSCNPRAISEFIQQEYKNDYEIIWAFVEPEKFKHLEKKGIKLVKYFSIKRMFYEATANASINNAGSYMWFPLRKNQLHINTWHGGGCYKKVGDGENDKGVFYKKIFLLKSKETTHFISSSKFFTDHVIRKECNYQGKVLEYGMPRNDILFKYKENVRKNVLERYSCPTDKMVIIYAPTWRYQANLQMPDFLKIKAAVKLRFGKECIFFFRAHNSMAVYESGNDIIDVSDYPDMQELLCASDILITDYSSSIWDYSFTYKPCFLYTTDLEQYTRERGFGRDIYTWGFPVCKNDEELYHALVNFDEEDFKKKMQKHHEDLGSYENGNATQQVCEYLIKEMEK